MKKTNKKILIIEDTESLRQAIKIVLDGAGYEVIEATDGVQGLLTALDTKPDLILLDLIMPRMSGIEMLNKLREDKWGEKAKVIILTNNASKAKVVEATLEGVDDYFVKSEFEIDDILIMVKNKLAKKK